MCASCKAASMEHCRGSGFGCLGPSERWKAFAMSPHFSCLLYTFMPYSKKGRKMLKWSMGDSGKKKTQPTNQKNPQNRPHHEHAYCNGSSWEKVAGGVGVQLSDFEISHSSVYRGLLTSSCYGQSPNKQQYFETTSVRLQLWKEVHVLLWYSI